MTTNGWMWNDMRKYHQKKESEIESKSQNPGNKPIKAKKEL